ncbi:unnamed protein product, partial [marine sediment metagenome]
NLFGLNLDITNVGDAPLEPYFNDSCILVQIGINIHKFDEDHEWNMTVWIGNFYFKRLDVDETVSFFVPRKYIINRPLKKEYGGRQRLIDDFTIDILVTHNGGPDPQLIEEITIECFHIWHFIFYR